MKILLSFYCLLFVFCFSVFSQGTIRTSAAWQVKKYEITASISDRTLTAKAVLNLQNVGNASGTRLTLRINDNAEVTDVQINGAAATHNKGQEAISSNRNLQRIIVNLRSTPPNATFTATINYTIKIDENSGLSSISPIGSQFLPLSFWYPTPNSHYAPKGVDFAPFKLTVSSRESVISSGTPGGNFDQRLNGQPFFLTGSWETIESRGVTVYLPKGASEFEKQRASELASLMAEAATFISSLLGPAPSFPMRIVSVRRGAGFADSGTILIDYAALRRQKIDSQTAMSIAESVAKIWLGNVKLVGGEGYGVIREGLSRFVATQFIEKQFGKAAADAERFRQLTAYATVARNDAPFNLAAPLDSTYYPSVTYKGAMIWRAVANEMGKENFFNSLKALDSYSIQGIRTAFAKSYEVLDYPLMDNTDTNLLVGLPQVVGAETKVALRNTGSFAANVNVSAVTDKGEALVQRTSIPAKSFGEVSFRTNSKIVRTEVDPEKFYPQTDFSDDVAPREFVDSNPIVAIKRAFDKQDYGVAEEYARVITRNQPYLDEAQTWLGRVLLAENRLTDAETIFRNTLKTKLPTPFTMAWANVGLGDIALKTGRNNEAAQFFDDAVKADAEYGATLAGRVGGQKLKSGVVDESVREFFVQFDKAVVSARKAEVDSLILSGEIPRFSGGVVGGQPERWETNVVRTEKIDANYTLAETTLSVKRLGAENIETGTAVFILVKVENNWRLAGFEVFEVR